MSLSFRRAAVILIVTVFISPQSVFAAEAGKEKVSPYAFGGYDLVTYATAQSPLKGDEQFVFDYGGKTFQFATRENLEAFKREPEKYLPAYGGWCTYAMVFGKKANADPTCYLIKDGRVLMFANMAAQVAWTNNEAEFKSLADKNWESIR